MNTPATVKADYLRAALNHALTQGGDWELYLLPSGIVVPFNPQTQRPWIDCADAALLFTAEVANLSRVEAEQAAHNAEARAALVDSLIDKHALTAAANELLADWWAEEEAADPLHGRWAARTIDNPRAQEVCALANL